MTNDKHQELMQSIGTIFNASRGCKMKTDLFDDIEKELTIVAEYLETGNGAAFLFSNIVSLYFMGREVEFTDLCRHFDADPFEVLPHMKHVEELISRGILTRKNGRRRMQEPSINKTYYVAYDLCEAILKEQVCPSLKKEFQSSLLDVLECMNDAINQCMDDELNAAELEEELDEIMTANKKFKFIKKLKGLNLSNLDRAVFVYVSWGIISGCRSVDIERLLRGAVRRSSERVRYMQEVYNGQNRLINENFLEMREARFLNDAEFSITDKTKLILEEDGIVMTMKNARRDDLILPKDIGAKELFYNTSEAAQIDKLKPMLEEEKYHELVSRLQSKNLPVGLNVLLFGAPGTGKTETALQLARFSGRQLIKIDISKTKSMWFGESEKIVKKIFSDYKEYASSQDLAPILLFNEADAILSNRGNIGSSNTRQTENAIQNILLEELENFKGIFIATTNLVKNLDPAFDRRFLFKVEFSKPGIQQRSLIWQSKLDFITGSDAAILADSFELSGGQIDNVARKCEINFVLNGEVPNLDQLMNYCSEESVVSKGTKKAIGFNTSQSLN
jgi:ATP-dependent 26S proteasome regulatory subunit